MSVRKTLFISNLSDLPSSEQYYTSRKYDSMEYVKKSIKYFVVSSLIGLFFAWILTLDGASIDPNISTGLSRVIIVAAFGYMGFSFHAGMSLIDAKVSFVTILILLVTGILALVFAFATAIGSIIAIPRFIINVRKIYK